jgi:hypothetical protein
MESEVYDSLSPYAKVVLEAVLSSDSHEEKLRMAVAKDGKYAESTLRESEYPQAIPNSSLV